MPETTTLVAEPRALSIPASIKELIEALIFAAEEPLSLEQIRTIVQEHSQEGDTRSLKENEIETIISVLNDEYQQSRRPYRIVRIAGGYQFATTVDYAEWIGKLHKEQGRRKLSQSSLETLAIIAYRQPITRSDIEVIRGVDCDYVLGTLLEKKLITIVGRAPTPGRPLLYGTTQQFLKHFGLNDISDLPRPREIEELLADARYETERRMLEAQEQTEKAKKQEEDFKSRLPHIPKKKPDLDDSAAIVPKKPGRLLTVKKTEEAQKAASQAEANERVQELPNAEASEIHDEIIPPTAKSAEQEISTSAEEEIHEPEESTTVVGTLTTAADKSVQAEETLLPVEHEVVSAELKVIEKLEQPANEPPPAVFDELSAMEETESRKVSCSVEPQKMAAGLSRNVSVQVEMTTPVLEAKARQQDEEPSVPQEMLSSTELKTQPECYVEQMPPPIDAMSAAADVAPPAPAPIIDEVREPAQPKSRWTQFKEKIQSFVKKLFG